MGWKNVKDYYKVEHIVCVENGLIQIGSPYVRDLIVVTFDGKVSWGHWESDEVNLRRHFKDLSSDKEKLVELINATDVFEKSIPIFYYNGGGIKEDFCEELGWPNVTHSGKIMYEGYVSVDRNAIVKKAKEDKESFIIYNEEKLSKIEEEKKNLQEHIERLRKEITELEAQEDKNGN